MILLCGVPADGPLAAVRTALGRRGAPAFLLDQSRADVTEIELSAGADLAGEIRLAGERCDLSGVSGAYVRTYSTRAATPGADADEALARHADRLDVILYDFLEVTPARVVNPAQAMATNASKPYQLAIVAAHGFAVPDTLVSTDPEAVLAFRARHEAVVYKSVSSVRSIVRRFSDDDAGRLADIAWCPTQFQQYVPGRDYRVHVVGDEVFACEVVSEADDYRYAKRQGEDVTVQASRVPAAVEGCCRALAASLGLAFAGIDLRLTPEGEWYCFEANPSPAFTYYEAASGQPIADAVAALLAGRASAVR